MAQDFADFMRWRLARDLRSQRWLERELDYKDGALRAVLQGRAGPRLQDLQRICEIMKLTPAEAQMVRVLALEAHGYQDLADELRDLHRRVDGLSRRVAEMENQYKV